MIRSMEGVQDNKAPMPSHREGAAYGVPNPADFTRLVSILKSGIPQGQELEEVAKKVAQEILNSESGDRGGEKQGAEVESAQARIEGQTLVLEITVKNLVKTFEARFPLEF